VFRFVSIARLPPAAARCSAARFKPVRHNYSPDCCVRAVPAAWS